MFISDQLRCIHLGTTRLVVTLAFLGVASMCGAEEPDDEIAAVLRYSDEIPGWYKPNHVDLETARQRGIGFCRRPAAANDCTETGRLEMTRGSTSFST